MNLLQEIYHKNWKSIAEARVELRALNLIVGANGSGKSNLISIFDLLHSMFEPGGNFRVHVAKAL